MLKTLDNWLIKKVAHSKVKDLFMVSKKELFSRIRELNEYIDMLEFKNETLQDTNTRLTSEVKKLGDKKSIREEITATEKELEQLKADIKTNKTELAYQGLLKKCEELQKENKGLKETIDIVQGGIKTISKQNEILKERVRRAESTVETLEAANKDLTEMITIGMEQNIELKNENKRLVHASENIKKLEPKQTNENIKVVNHSFSKQSNNNRSVNKKNNLVITRQVNN